MFKVPSFTASFIHVSQLHIDGSLHLQNEFDCNWINHNFLHGRNIQCIDLWSLHMRQDKYEDELCRLKGNISECVDEEELVLGQEDTFPESTTH